MFVSALYPQDEKILFDFGRQDAPNIFENFWDSVSIQTRKANELELRKKTVILLI